MGMAGYGRRGEREWRGEGEWRGEAVGACAHARTWVSAWRVFGVCGVCGGVSGFGVCGFGVGHEGRNTHRRLVLQVLALNQQVALAVLSHGPCDVRHSLDLGTGF
jgi:hypothetical protein